MNKIALIITLCTIAQIAMAYENLITLSNSTKRGGKSSKQVINEYKSDSAVVFFARPGCRYCTILKPRFTTVARQNKDKAQFIVMNVGNDSSYKSSYGFSTYPTVAYYKNGRKVRSHGSNNGSMTTSQMQNIVNSVYPPSP